MRISDWSSDVCSSDLLRALGDDPLRWRDIASRFHGWHELWQQRGVLALVNALIETIAADQLDGIGGERTLTDLRHLGELLQAQSDAEIGSTSCRERVGPSVYNSVVAVQLQETNTAKQHHID